MSILFKTILMKINKISPRSSNFLKILENIEKSPEKLYFIGQIPDTRKTTVAIVGSRKPTAYGKEVTYQITRDLAKRDIVIVSGLALGIDSIAHRAAIDVGGTTLAIIGGSVDKIYPASNKTLADDIIKGGGAIISEYQPPTSVRPYQFLERNRIISGLSDAIVVTEAAIHSGTLSTVTHALEQGREVFVVPGNITSPLSAGCNNLIKQGAHPITCAEDVLEVIAPDLLNIQPSLALGSTPLESKIIELLQSGIRDGDELQNLCEVTASEYSTAMTMMEIAGIIRALGGNQWTLK